ncbi:hypothetical protein DAI22_07g004232 [Oryza sativa Japonica Group]|nr:hypothetical protein DAI22_07g004232 [Oryza sativa Japonica Group]
MGSASSATMGRAMMMRAAWRSSRPVMRFAHRHRLLHGTPSSHRTTTTPTKEEVDIILDCLKETGTKSMDMATLDQTTYFVNSALSGAMARRVERACASAAVVIMGFTLDAFSATRSGKQL